MQQSGDGTSDLEELKTELATVVDALSVLHEFIDSVFGLRYQNFLGGVVEESAGRRRNVQSALRKLGWRQCSRLDSNGREEEIDGDQWKGGRRESKADHGYASAGGTPVLVEDKHMTFGDLDNTFIDMTEEDKRDRRLSVSLGASEVIAVKCEVEEADVDFLDDVDPFGSELDDYNVQPIKVEGYSFETPNYDTEHNFKINPAETEPPSCHQIHTSPRYIPELIPIQQELKVPAVNTTGKELSSSCTNNVSGDVDAECASVSSGDGDNSDPEWQPKSPSINKHSPKTKERTQRECFNVSPDYRSVVSPFGRSPSTNMAYSRHTSSVPLTVFTCDQCPATYKQEESLRSHQKYKHNPSRVTCTCHLCGKSMVDKYRLQRHLRLHTGEKPFECTYCGQSFYRKDYHTKHLQRKHGISYTATVNNASRPVKKPKTCPSSSSITTSSSTSSSSSLQGFLSNVFESSSPYDKNSVIGSTTPSCHSTSAAHPHAFGDYQQHKNLGVYTSGHSTGHHHTSTEDSSAINNLMTMTSLTFDDLISADF